MSEDVYLKLRDFMEGLPGGFPTTDSGVELRLLKKLFQPEEAAFMLHLNQWPEPVSAIAARAGMDETAAVQMLESMAKQGSIFRIRLGDASLYMAMSFLIGVYEFHLKSIDREFAELMHEFEPHIMKSWEAVQTKQLRVVPIGAAIPTEHQVAGYDLVRDLVAKHDKIAVADCICRVERGVMGEPCERPLETCLVFGFAADYYVENGIGRMISADDCLGLLTKAEDEALVVCPSNAQDFVNI